MAKAAVPLLVDLPALLRTDLVAERRVAALGRVALDPARLPVRDRLLDELRHAREQGRTVVLVWAGEAGLAEAVASHLDLFDRVVAGNRNDARPALLSTVLDEHFGESVFDLVGSRETDDRAWRLARQAWVVGGPRLVRRVAAIREVAGSLSSGTGGGLVLLQSLRPHQWAKNLLVFVPLLTSHRIGDTAVAARGVLAFLSFCLVASAGYLVNDVWDLQEDRSHPERRRRPLASGALPLSLALVLVPLLAAGGLGLGLLLDPLFLPTLLAYLLGTLAYSLLVKRWIVADVLLLAGLYTARVIGGGTAVSIPISFWLLAFSMFLFSSLALVKRCAELGGGEASGRTGARARGYGAEDRVPLLALGLAAGSLAVGVLALYVNSPEIRLLYRHPPLIWLLCPLLLYWVGRIWILTWRGEMPFDPVVFALRDRVSRWVGLLAALVVWLAI